MQAEIAQKARLQEQAVQPPIEDPWSGPWGDAPPPTKKTKTHEHSCEAAEDPWNDPWGEQSTSADDPWAEHVGLVSSAGTAPIQCLLLCNNLFAG